MKKSKYYVRILYTDKDSFTEYMQRNDIEFTSLSIEMGSTILYSTSLTPEEASSLRLSFNFVGFLNFNKNLNRQEAIFDYYASKC